jgi:hypothetical protein
MKHVKRLAVWMSTFCFLCMVILWILGVALLIRSRYRSDFAAIALAHRYFYVACDDGLIDVATSSLIFNNQPLLSWSSSAPSGSAATGSKDRELFGPNVRSCVKFNASNDPNDPEYPNRYHSWRRFSCGHGVENDCQYVNEINIGIGSPFRDSSPVIWLGEIRQPDIIGRERCAFVSIPVWSLPGVLAVAPVLWLLTAGRQRLRRYRRASGGLCRRCGYDMRGTPVRCPECGIEADSASRRPGGWRIAFYSVLIALLGIAVFLNRLNPVQESKPSTDDRRPSQIGMAIPWNPEAERPDLLTLALGDNGPYTVRVDLLNPAIITILRDGKVICDWRDTQAAAFKIFHDVLYRQNVFFNQPTTDFGQKVRQTTIKAIDLHNGRQLWESSLIDSPRLQPSQGLYLDVRDGRLVIWADDPSGRYSEVKDLQTGKTIGYCLYKR